MLLSLGASFYFFSLFNILLYISHVIVRVAKAIVIVIIKIER